MELVEDHEWRLELTTGSSADERFKFDVHGDWQLNFGDNDGDQTVDEGGGDISLPTDQTVIIHFNDESRFYWVEERTWQAEVSLSLPSGVDAQVLRMQRAQLAVDGAPYGWTYIYVDGEHPAPYVPVCCLSMGAEATLSFDSITGGKRLVGEVTWTVDGAEDPIVREMNVTEASLDDYGAVELSVLADRWENDHIVSGPFSSVGIYLGDWHAGNELGHTGEDGKTSFMLPGGDHSLSAMVMTSSHSMASASMPLSIEAGSFVSTELHMAPTTVYIHAHYDAGMGRALYITGASDYLGNWEQATRMTYNGGIGAWTYERNLPMGAPFKIVMAPWSDEVSIPTDAVQWEQGSNHTVTPPSGYVSSDIAVYPSF